MTRFSFYTLPKPLPLPLPLPLLGPPLVPEPTAPASAGSTLSPEAPAPAPAPAPPCLRRLETGRSQGKVTSSSELSFLQKLLQDSLILQQGRRIFG